ncbi:hypothetical protein [Streptomyces sp. NPDC047070]|uniref:hypothetical protein n=1 Tax=Streptomyces sp. NPDC047070 TaxID=3154923 RepID=UPI0034519BC3
MGDHYEAVFSCFLRDDTPDSVLAALRWHLGLESQEPEGLDPEDHPYQLLVPNHNSRLPGGDMVFLRRTAQESTPSGARYEWELFARCYWVDDCLLQLDALLSLIAPHAARAGYAGHIRDEYGTGMQLFTFHDGTYDPVDLRHT